MKMLIHVYFNEKELLQRGVHNMLREA